MTEANAQIDSDEPLRLLSTGSRYSFGFGTDFYGIWDEAAPGKPVQHFPATPAGRKEAWDRYVQLEPAASQETTSSADTVIEFESRKGKKRGRYVVLALIVAAGALWFFTRGGAEEGGNGTVVNAGTAAHVDITGGITVSDDMEQTAFSISGIGSLTGGSSRAEWTGAAVDLQLVMNPPTVGSKTTGQVTENRTLQLVITQNGATITALSSHGECSITLTAVADEGMAGTFECKGLAAGEAGPIDATGTFGATASA